MSTVNGRTGLLEHTTRTQGITSQLRETGRSLLASDRDAALVAVRLTLAVVFFPHGAQKLLGWFGGPGLEGAMQFLTGGMGLPAPLALLVILIEFFGPLALAAGFLGRLAAAGIAAVMVGAVFTTHLSHGFFMNWSGAQAGEGIEYHLLVLGMAAAIVIGGSGSFSVDRLLAGRRERHVAGPSAAGRAAGSEPDAGRETRREVTRSRGWRIGGLR